MNPQDEKHDPMDDYLEALGVNREIEFIYNNVSYRFEPNYEKNGYDIWRYSDGFKTGGGEVIAYASTPEEALSLKCFDDKSFSEIEGEATHKYIV